MITGDASYIKRINRSLIVREIVKAGMISRAELSKATRLTKATISAQAADLLNDGLVIEREVEHKSVGRKPIMLTLNADAGCAVGIDLEYGRLAFTVTDLLGRPVASDLVALETTNYEDILALLIRLIDGCRKTYADRRYGVVGTVISIHGLVSTDERIHYVPRFNWHNLHMKQDLERALGAAVNLENNANLSALAERAFAHHDRDNLLCLTLYSGIGMGMLIRNEFFRGHDGFAGEIGHMIVVPEGIPCTCGNKGCWENYASETSVCRGLSADGRGIPDDGEIKRRLQAGDPAVMEAMERFIYYLSIGLNNLINIHNPEAVVLDSELLRLYPNALDKLRAGLHSRISHCRELSLSTLGKKSSVLGACALAIQSFLGVPMISLPYEA